MVAQGGELAVAVQATPNSQPSARSPQPSTGARTSDSSFPSLRCRRPHTACEGPRPSARCPQTQQRSQRRSQAHNAAKTPNPKLQALNPEPQILNHGGKRGGRGGEGADPASRKQFRAPSKSLWSSRCFPRAYCVAFRWILHAQNPQ